ncbi:trifunctional serine/threonine-protein kinase/ATP-binding protein/sensor histidine kinase [Baaleninema simplex]|uniref:trifunctional serine/threonine-protein kinase/ATP-binding protein/sensor histidine kinase n=1 Tax=Baaleninema simplex TaxID=2862350 RepID=UPI00034881DF|nr:ATP-binding sensor histidine kinase [Baaleninema simplex]
MLSITGYHIVEQLYESQKNIVYRAQRNSDGKPVILKVLRTNYPTPKEVAKIRHECEITKNLKIDGIIHCYGLEKYNGLTLVLEDIGGISLGDFIIQNKLDTIAVLKIVAQLVDTLGKLHEKNVIHKDIKPLNIIFNPQTGQTKLTDFSIASSLSRESQSVRNPNLLEGTLAYMSPEQTGRMNRAIDYRTDFYSLGATFYELLTGRLPFSASDPMELVYCHMAKKPVPPHGIDPTVPVAVSDIVMKLLEKIAEDRYQSAYGIRADLTTCLTQLQTSGIVSKFTLGQYDVSAKFQIPQKLYGREREIAILTSAFERVCRATTELVLVSGYSGIGKTALIHEIHKPIVQRGGYFISGKCDQYRKNVPYASLIQAFQDLIRQLLTESAEKIAVWRQKLLDALGTNGQVIIDAIPEVESIVGKQAEVLSLGTIETQNRFNLVFRKFIEVFAQKDHPLVIFLDDLQWADSATLKSLEIFATEFSHQSLLVVGAYRNNEVGATHLLTTTLENVRNNGTRVSDLNIQPLDRTCTERLVADTLHCPVEKSRSLAELVFNKTAGNPFFLTQLLISLYQEELLTFDATGGCWRWDNEQIRTRDVTDNVVELMVSKIQKLGDTTQHVLKLAACIGNTFDLNVLAIVNEKSPFQTASELQDALQEELVLPTSDAYNVFLLDELDKTPNWTDGEYQITYRFLHDRVQQATYSSISEADKKAIHLKVGRLLLRHTPPQEIEENIFEIVNHLNLGVESIVDRSEKDNLARLNAIAGHKAKISTAYETAAKYLTLGVELLAPDSWDTLYDLTLKLYVEAVEVEYLSARFDRATQLAEVVQQRAKTLLDKVEVYQIQIQSHISQNQMQAALDVALFVLEMLGEPLTSASADDLSPNASSDLPEMKDPVKLAALQTLMNAMPPAYVAAADLLPAIAQKMVCLCVQYGNSPLAAYAYAFYGLMLCGALGDIEKGYQFGRLAIEILDRFETREYQCKIYELFNAHIRHWKEPVGATLEPLKEAVQIGLETGDIEYAGYAAMYASIYPLFMGESLEVVQQQQQHYIDLLIDLNQPYFSSYIAIWRQWVLNLTGDTENPQRLAGKSFDEDAMLPKFVETNNGALLFTVYLAKAMLLYSLNDYEAALDMARLSDRYSGFLLGLMHTPVHHFYYSLILLAQCPRQESPERRDILDLVASNQEKLKNWAFHAPENYQHKYLLVEAEKARVLGQTLEAMEYYDRAVRGAIDGGFVQEESLANERAAEFYLACDREKVARTYFTEAYYGYIRWGATVKANRLEATVPHLISRVVPATIAERLSTATSTSASENVNVLDLITVVKASQALAGEIVLSQLLDKLLRIVMENAAAQTSCLLLEKDGQLRIEATGNLDKDEVLLLPSLSTNSELPLPLSVLNYVARTKEGVVLNDATRDSKFASDPYMVRTQPKSVLCTPIVNQGKFIGLLYLENNLTIGAFKAEQLEILNLLSSQIAISLENALLYANVEATTEDLKRTKSQLEEYNSTLEQKVEDRTLELIQKNQRLKEQSTQLEQTLSELKKTQMQLIQTEKMSSLGNLVAGVAHEINNPISFIHGNLIHAEEYSRDLLNLIQLYREEYPNPTPKIQIELDRVELDFLERDLHDLVRSMQTGADRIRQIVLSLRNFSRLQEASLKPVDLHEGLKSTLFVLHDRLVEKPDRPEIRTVEEYGNLPLVECYAGELNQAFLNIIDNAIDVLESRDRDLVRSQIEQNPSTIWIRTAAIDRDWVEVAIADNGPGMTETVRSRLFDPFFTTKPVGSGTGLGLSISYQIIVDKHGGKISCISRPDGGTEFQIQVPVRQRKLSNASS